MIGGLFQGGTVFIILFDSRQSALYFQPARGKLRNQNIFAGPWVWTSASGVHRIEAETEPGRRWRIGLVQCYSGSEGRVLVFVCFIQNRDRLPHKKILRGAGNQRSAVRRRCRIVPELCGDSGHLQPTEDIVVLGLTKSRCGKCGGGYCRLRKRSFRATLAGTWGDVQKINGKNISNPGQIREPSLNGPLMSRACFFEQIVVNRSSQLIRAGHRGELTNEVVQGKSGDPVRINHK